MPATVQAQYFGASATLPAGANAEGGATFNREDTLTGTTPVPIPVAAGVNFSWIKQFQLAITATSTTTMSNRTVRISAGFATGLGMHWKAVAQASYINQTSASGAPADTTGTNNAATAPSTYTAFTTSAVQYDNTSQATSSTGIGTTQLLVVLLAVDATYAGGPGSASLGNIVLGYDEAHHRDKLERDAVAWGRDPIGTSARPDRCCRRRGRRDSW
jgi:hypothetical protein